jgi:hypothetical protein
MPKYWSNPKNVATLNEAEKTDGPTIKKLKELQKKK